MVWGGVAVGGQTIHSDLLFFFQDGETDKKIGQTRILWRYAPLILAPIYNHAPWII